ncbi:MAG: homoserine dehydrogenase, partial [Elusimicrobiota bacterium]|nr:homoserine dehydrogenase [Elusimicrobiota bacterium]
MKKKKIFLGLIGLGTVGSRVLKLFYKNKSIIEQKIGANIEFLYLCDKNKYRLQESLLPSWKGVKRTTYWQKVVYNPKVDIVIELVGGENPARAVIVESLKNNKHVVTANKLVLANHWSEIFSVAHKKQKLVYFEASVGAGIPVIQALNEGLAGNRIFRIAGILNGTTNYILTKMLRENLTFEVALKEAQKHGFAEPNSKLDIEGHDTLHKVCILASIALSTWVKPENVYCEGISKLNLLDVKFAYSEFGYVTKLLGIATIANRQKSSTPPSNQISLFVRPCLIPSKHTFATVENEFNAVLLEGDACGEIIFYGRGAGGEAAASAVVSDIMFLARQVASNFAGKIPYVTYSALRELKYLPVEELEGCYYLRFTTV